MIFAANTLLWLAVLIRSILWLLILVVLAAALLRWFLPGYHPARLSLESLSRPLLRPLRNGLGRLGLPRRIDLAPFLFALLLWFAAALATRAIVSMALAIKPFVLVRPGPWLTIIQVLSYLIYAYMFLVLLRALLSWTGAPRSATWVIWLLRATEPPLRWARRLQPRRWVVDFSPLIVLLALSFVDQVLLRSWLEYVAG